jgi:hypothetical protein
MKTYKLPGAIALAVVASSAIALECWKSDPEGRCSCADQQYTLIVPDGMPCAGTAVVPTGSTENGRTAYISGGYCSLIGSYNCQGVPYLTPEGSMMPGKFPSGNWCGGA